MNCESKKYRRIVVKIGSNVLTREDGRPDTTRISALVDQLARLHRAGTEFILVSSGAVASGRSLLETRVGRIDTVSARQLFSAVGQVKLLNRYYDLFNEYGIACGQVLTTKESLSTRRQYLNQRNCMEAMLAAGVVPIVNENDTISVTELMFTDNDELSGLVAAMMGAEALVILSNIDGIYDGSPSDPASQVIRRVAPGRDLSQYIDTARSSRGRGGMTTKSRISSRGGRGHRGRDRQRPPRQYPDGSDPHGPRRRMHAFRSGSPTGFGGQEVDRQQRRLRQGRPAPRRRGRRGRLAEQGREHPRRGRHGRRRGFRARRHRTHPLARRRPAGRGPHLVRQRDGPPQPRPQRSQTADSLRLPISGIKMEYDTIFVAARRAGNELALVDAGRLSRTVAKAAALLRENAGKVLAANALDLEAMDADSPMRDRLRLTAERIASIAADMESVAGLPSPQGETIAEWTRPNGMTLRKVRVPFGVVGMICEARPNVTADIFSLSMKTGNACVLKGGSDARRSNEAIAALLREALRSEGIDPAAFTLLPAGHEAAGALLNAVGYVDVVIPRGGAGLIRFVRENARIPVIETGAGIVHTYFDLDGDLTKGRAVVCNAKTRRVSVCNALDCLIVHRERLRDLAELCDPMAAERVTVYADAEAYAALEGRYPACLLRPAAEEHFGTEFLDYKLAVRTVGSLDEALAHIARYSSRHSEAIVTENAGTAREFTRRVDAACVYVNVSTAFTDGGQFGFGAEVGISTQKLHARGPMGLPELTTYKYVISGNGQTREP